MSLVRGFLSCACCCALLCCSGYASKHSDDGSGSGSGDLTKTMTQMSFSASAPLAGAPYAGRKSADGSGSGSGSGSGKATRSRVSFKESAPAAETSQTRSKEVILDAAKVPGRRSRCWKVARFMGYTSIIGAIVFTIALTVKPRGSSPIDSFDRQVNGTFVERVRQALAGMGR